jgi:hypothetical protein
MSTQSRTALFKDARRGWRPLLTGPSPRAGLTELLLVFTASPGTEGYGKLGLLSVMCTQQFDTGNARRLEHTRNRSSVPLALRDFR